MAVSKRSDLVLATVPNRVMNALRAYWTAMDLDHGPRNTHFWDLRFGMVNRWMDEDTWPAHIRYGVAFKRTDGIDALDYAQDQGSLPPPPQSWNLVFREGTFPRIWNPAYDLWLDENLVLVSKIDEEQGWQAADRYVRRHGPPEYLPNPENWDPEQAAAELENTIPKAVDFFESDRMPVDWKPKISIIEFPE
jgi:hypothetical protein